MLVYKAASNAGQIRVRAAARIQRLDCDLTPHRAIPDSPLPRRAHRIACALPGGADIIPHPMAKPSAVPASFEAALAELEEIVATMEGGQLPLKESLAAYKRGAELLQYCQSTLKDAEQQVAGAREGRAQGVRRAGRRGCRKR